MIWDIMYELPLFGEWRVVRAADALLTATHDPGGLKGARAAEGCLRETHSRAPTGS